MDVVIARDEPNREGSRSEMLARDGDEVRDEGRRYRRAGGIGERSRESALQAQSSRKVDQDTDSILGDHKRTGATR